MGTLKLVPQALELGTPDMIRDVFEGKKQISVRTDHRGFVEGNRLVLYHESEDDQGIRGAAFATATIGPVRHTTLAEVTEEEWTADGFDSQGALLAGLQAFYGDSITLDSAVTVVTWHSVQGKQVDWYFDEEVD